MTARLFVLLLVAALPLSAGCGDTEEPPTLGGNNENSVDEDTGSGSIFPDVTINNSRNQNPNNNNPPDMGPPDLGRDMAVVPSDMTMPPDMAPDLPVMMNCPRSGVAQGQPCRCNQECASGVCVDATVTDDGFCSATCASSADCAAGETCVEDSFGDKVCRFDDTDANCGQAGQSAPAMCSAGYCLQAGTNFVLDHFCSVPCTGSSDCKTGHACSPVRCQFGLDGHRCLPTVIAQRAPNTATLLAAFPISEKLCVAVGAPNPCVNVMSDEQACQGSVCDASPVGRCTAQCVGTLDCPSGGCVDFDLSDATLPIRVCDL